MNHYKSLIVLALLGICGLFVMALGCSDDASYETHHNNADSETGKPNDSETGKPDDSDTGKSDSETGKPNDSETGKPDDSDTGSGTDSNKPEPSPESETWVDGTTGLEWQITPPEDAMQAWYAMKYCEGLDLGGHQDWRLPNLSELRSIIRGCPFTETGGGCPYTAECLDVGGGTSSCYEDYSETYGCGTGCSLQEGVCYGPSQLQGCGTYWSITPQASSDTYYRVRFSNASIDASHVSQEHKCGVRCVRGG
ncbi:MAG: DUF1566 domain-containing protein [Proteobacteria bacterium]|nr:DUF1566 domain-containing protein [Pseudomonadota bacterium]